MSEKSNTDGQPSPSVIGRPSVVKRLMRVFFRLLYHDLAWTYDLVAWVVSFGQWRAWGRAAIPRLRGSRVLDLAHGPGHLLVAMRRAGLTPVGLDLSPQMGRLAQARLEKERRRTDPHPQPFSQKGRRENGGIIRARAQAMPFRSGAFDSVVSTFPAEFIVDPATLAEIARVIESDGCAVVVPGVAFKKNWPARALEWLYTVTGQQEPPPPRLAQALAQVGLTLETAREPMGMVDVLIAVAKKTSPSRGPG